MGLEMNQKVGEYSTVMGWYGKCGDNVCESVELSEHANIIHQVFQWSADAVTAKSFVSEAPPQLNDFTTLECGKAYLIYLKPALNSGSINTLTLEHFVSSSSEDENLGGVGEPSCLTEVVVTTLGGDVVPGDDVLVVPAEVTTELTNALIDSEGKAFVTIDEGTDIEETAEIKEAGSFVLVNGLVYSHSSGATLRTFVGMEQPTWPVDPADSLAVPTIESGLESDVDCTSLANGTDAWEAGNLARLSGSFNQHWNDYIEWTAGKDGVLESIDVLCRNGGNAPGDLIRGYVMENNGVDTKASVRWTLTYDMIAAAQAASANDSDLKVSHTSSNGSHTQTFYWVNIPIKGEIGQKRGVKYRMQIAADPFTHNNKDYAAGFQAKHNRFCFIATGNHDKLNDNNRQDVNWNYTNYFAKNTFPFIRTNVGCNTSKSCDGTWYDNTLTAANSGLCSDDGVATVDIDDKNGVHLFGGHYVYSGETPRAVYNYNETATEVVQVPYYLRDGNVPSSYNADFGYLKITGQALGTLNKPLPGIYKKVVGEMRWDGPSSYLQKDSNNTWVLVHSQYMDPITSTGTSAVMNESVFTAAFWAGNDVNIESGSGKTGDLMLFQSPSHHPAGSEAVSYNWQLAPFHPQQEVTGVPTQMLAWTLSDGSMNKHCLFDMAIEVGNNGKLPLMTNHSFNSSYIPHSEILVDPTAGPSGPGGDGSGDVSYLRLFKRTDSGDAPCISFTSGPDNGNADIVLIGEYEIDEDATGFIHSTTYNGDMSGPAQGSMLDLFQDTANYPSNDVSLGNQPEWGYTYLVKASWFTENSDVYDFRTSWDTLFPNSLPEITHDKNYVQIQQVCPTNNAGDLDGGQPWPFFNLNACGQLHQLRGMQKPRFNKAMEFSTEPGEPTSVEEWVGDDPVWIVGYFFNPMRGWSNATQQYYNVGTFTLATQSGMAKCNI